MYCFMNEVREWLTALMTPVIGFLGIWIAYQQHKNKKYALRRDVMSERLIVFNAVRDLLESSTKNILPPLEALDRFNTATTNATFLFKPEVTNYLDQLRENYLEMWSISSQQAEEGFMDKLEETVLLDKRRKLRSKMREQLVEAKNVFKGHMDLSDA